MDCFLQSFGKHMKFKDHKILRLTSELPSDWQGAENKTHVKSHSIISIKTITDPKTFQTYIYNICSAHLAWTYGKITLRVLTYDTIQSKKCETFHLKFWKF